MDLVAKKIPCGIYRCIKLSYGICSRHPKTLSIVWVALSLIFLVHKFLPSVLGLLIRSTPVFICTAVLLRLLLRFDDHYPPQNHKEGGGGGGGGAERKKTEQKLGRSLSQAHSVRRLEKKQVVQGDKGEEEFVLPSPKQFFDKIIGNKENCNADHAVVQDVGKVDGTQPADTSSSINGGSNIVPDLVSRNGYDEWFHKMDEARGEPDAESPEEPEDEDEDEPREEGDRKKLILEWTDDDQKNLMDLGTSEMERNRRLESLIEKRRLRKSMKLQVEKYLIAPSLIARTKPLIVSGFDDSCQSPGSAPCALLPKPNPFDLPYDPHEEKPNLTGDSFQQEFMPPCPKDMYFCRHESFSFGLSFPGEYNKRRPYESKFGPFWANKRRPSAYSRLQSQLGENYGHEGTARQKSHQEGSIISQNENSVQDEERASPKLEMRSEPAEHCSVIRNVEDAEENNQDTQVTFDEENKFHEKVESGGEENDQSGSSSSSEASVPDFNTIKDKVLENLNPRRSDVFSFGAKQPAHSTPSSTFTGSVQDFNPFNNIEKGAEPQLFDSDNGLGLIPSHSIAADLHVDISEIGSTTPAERDPSMSDGIVDKDMISGSEEACGVSPLLDGTERNESRLREVHQISKENISEIGFFKAEHSNVQDSISSPAVPPIILMVEQSSGTNKCQPDAMICDDQKSSDEVQNVEPRKCGSSSSLDAMSLPAFNMSTLDRPLEGSTYEAAKESNQHLHSEDEKDIEEVGFPGAGAVSDDLVESATEPESMVEQVSNSSVPSSPNSVLPKVVPVDQVPLNFNQNTQIDIHHSDLEGTTAISPEKVLESGTLEAQPCNVENPENTHLQATIINSLKEANLENESKLNSEHMKDLASGSGKSVGQEETNFRYIKDKVDMPEKLIEREASHDPLLLAVKSDCSDRSLTMDPSIVQEKSSEHSSESTISNRDDQIDIKFVEESQGEIRFSIRGEAVMEPSKGDEAGTSSIHNDDGLSKPENISGNEAKNTSVGECEYMMCTTTIDSEEATELADQQKQPEPPDA